MRRVKYVPKLKLLAAPLDLFNEAVGSALSAWNRRLTLPPGESGQSTIYD